MAFPGQGLDATRVAVRRALADLAPGDVVLVACSGGPDSLALAAATAFTAPRGGLRAGAVCVDHGLQSGSAEVSRDAAARCRDLGLDPVETVAVRVPARGGPEGAARTARYQALQEAAERHGARAVLLGHTRDDQAESVLLALGRGSGTRSLAGMPAVRGVFRRPLLGLPRALTEQACRDAGLTPWMDPSNAPEGPLRTADGRLPPRVAVRAHALPALEAAAGPGVPGALARTAELLRDDADLLDELAWEAWARLRPDAAALDGDRVGPEVDEVMLDVEALCSLHPALRRRVLRTAIGQVGRRAREGHAATVTATHLAAVDGLLTDWHGQGEVGLPGGVLAGRACGRLVLRSAHHASPGRPSA